jgi:hypothetical protein
MSPPRCVPVPQPRRRGASSSVPGRTAMTPGYSLRKQTMYQTTRYPGPAGLIIHRVTPSRGKAGQLRRHWHDGRITAVTMRRRSTVAASLGLLQREPFSAILRVFLDMRGTGTAGVSCREGTSPPRHERATAAIAHHHVHRTSMALRRFSLDSGHIWHTNRPTAPVSRDASGRAA